MVKKVLVSVLVAYLGWCVLHPSEFHAIDYVNLIMHEAGHWIFFISGEFVSVFGGSFLQVFTPIVFAGYFFHEKDRFGFTSMLAWAGESLSNVSNYISDGLAMNLTLLGGDAAIHDWNHILNSLGIVRYSEAIGQCVWIVAIIIVAYAFVLVWLPQKPNTGITIR